MGGGDSAVESAMLLADQNEVTLSYRKDVFQRIKAKNMERIQQAIEEKKVKTLFNTNLTKIEEHAVTITTTDNDQIELENDRVYIFAGGELPTQFLEKIGLQITKKYGEAILKH